jgi:3-phenylpropionate/trans-cinnamate dioxygenase ferredoxin reductase subunit
MTVMADRTYVIVGASLAGAKAAEALRESGFDGRVLLVGDERERPYERPKLSKEILKGDKPREKAFVHEEGWYDEHHVELRLGTAVTALHREEHQVELAGGERIGYDKVLLATGSSPRRLEVSGGDLDGIHYLRRIGESERLRDELAAGGSLVVVGGGWIGLEVAAAARTAGCDVVVVEPLAEPLLRVLGPEVARIFAALHRRHGVELKTSTNVTDIRSRPATGAEADGVPATVHLDDGTATVTDLLVVGIGAAPDTGLAEAAGLDVDDGVLADEHLRTSDPDVFVAGDIAHAAHPTLGRRVRVEHWDNALKQGATAARNMLGADEPYDRLPYFFTDQYDLGMEYVGYASADDDVEVRGDLDGREFVALWTREGKVVAGMNVNVWDVTDRIRDLILAGEPADAFELPAPSA